MKRLLVFVACLGVATLAGAQQKSDVPAYTVSPFPDLKGDTPTLPVVDTYQDGRSTTVVFDISGQQSWDLLYDSSNTILFLPIPTGNLMTGIGWDVTISTVGASWLSEARVYFDGSDRDGYGLFLTPGVVDSFPGTGTYSSGGIIDLTDNGIPDIPILADGLLWIELFEGFDDVPDAVDANWLPTSTLTIVYEEPPPPRYPLWIEDFDGGTWPPAGWNVVDNTGSGSWELNTFFSRPNYTPGSGDCAAIDSDWYGIGPLIDGELWTMPFDVPNCASTLEYDMDYQNFAGLDYADVDISLDGGVTWTNLVQYNSDLTGHFSVDLTPYAGATGVIVSFHYYIGDYFWWWQVDNVGLYISPTATFRNDAGNTNATGFTASTPALGTTMTFIVDNTGTTNYMAGVMGYENPAEVYMPRADGYLLFDPLSPGGELLKLPAYYGYTEVMFEVPLPVDVNLLGFTLSTQGAGAGGEDGLTLHNAYDLCIGS